MKQHIQALSTYLNALTIRERALSLLVAMTVIYAAWDGLLFSKQEQHYQQLLAKQASFLEQQQKRDAEIALTTAMLVANQRTVEEKKQAIKQAQTELQQTTLQLDSVLNKLVPPTKITELLQSLLLQTHGLQLLSLSNGAVEDITLEDKQDESADRATKSHLYKHSTTIKLAGNYRQLYQYLTVLENSEWGLYWDKLDYQVTQYPNAEISIRVHTISTDEYWIGL